MIALQDRPRKAIATSDSYVIEISSDLFYNLHCDNPQDFGLLLMNLSRDIARVILTWVMRWLKAAAYKSL